jgi:hypothetical protein
MGQAKRRGTFEQRRDAAIKLYKEKQAEQDKELDRNYVAPYGRAKSLLPMYGLAATMSLSNRKFYR